MAEVRISKLQDIAIKVIKMKNREKKLKKGMRERRKGRNK